MPIVDVRGFNLVPDIGAQLGRGLQVAPQLSALEQQGRMNQIRQLLGQASQPATEQQQMLAAQTADMGVQDQGITQAGPTREQLVQQARQIDPILAEKTLNQMGMDDAGKRAEASRFAAQLQGVPFDQRGNYIQARAQKLQSEGRDPKDTLSLLDLNEQQQNQALTNVQLMDLSTQQRLTLQQKAQADAAKAGLKSTEVQASQILPDGTTVFAMKNGTTKVTDASGNELTGEARGNAIKSAQEYGVSVQQMRAQGRGLGADAAKAADKAVVQINNIRSNNSTLKRVIDEVRGGAETGPLADKLPSFRAATVRLNQLKNKLGLDVVGSVTFGALSEGELKLALNTALPTNLQGPELVKWAEDKINAQEKLARYLEDQTIFLSNPGNTRADWIEYQRSQARPAPESGTTVQPASAPAPTIQFMGFE